ncbi:hypothetical protein C3941_02840 [Kaistia algarum]|nr:hypothetical protein C3941_02840 [Kaistia algarum]
MIGQRFYLIALEMASVVRSIERPFTSTIPRGSWPAVFFGDNGSVPDLRLDGHRTNRGSRSRVGEAVRAHRAQPSLSAIEKQDDLGFQFRPVSLRVWSRWKARHQYAHDLP